MSNEKAVKTSQLTNAVKQMSDYLKGKIDNNATQLNEKRKNEVKENIQKIVDAIVKDLMKMQSNVIEEMKK